VLTPTEQSLLTTPSDSPEWGQNGFGDAKPEANGAGVGSPGVSSAGGEAGTDGAH